MKKKLKIGILTHNYPVNSEERKDAGIFIYDFAQELSKNADVFILCPDFGGKKQKYLKTPVTWFKWDKSNEKFGNWKLYNPIYVYKFFKLFYIGQKEATKFAKENKIDYILSCWSIPSAILAWRVKSVVDIPYASWSLGSDVNKYTKIPILSQLIYLSLKKADRLYANSYKLCSEVNKISKKKCNFLPAITNFTLKKIDKIKKDNSKFNFLYVGRLEKVKGPDILIGAIKELSKTNTNFMVNVLGDGSMGEELKRSSSEVKKYINFVGWADESKVGGYMKVSDSLVVPSRNESLPLVMIEAAKLNLPVVATNVGDCKRMIVKYGIGETCDKEDVKGLAKAMGNMMNGQHKKKGDFAHLVKDFSQTQTVKRFLAGVISME